MQSTQVCVRAYSNHVGLPLCGVEFFQPRSSEAGTLMVAEAEGEGGVVSRGGGGGA